MSVMSMLLHRPDSLKQMSFSLAECSSSSSVVSSAFSRSPPSCFSSSSIAEEVNERETCVQVLKKQRNSQTERRPKVKGSRTSLGCLRKSIKEIRIEVKKQVELASKFFEAMSKPLGPEPKKSKTRRS